MNTMSSMQVEANTKRACSLVDAACSGSCCSAANAQHPTLFHEYARDMASGLGAAPFVAFVGPQSLLSCLSSVVEQILAKGSCPALAALPLVSATSDANIAKFQRCTAIHGRLPMLMLVDMPHDASYVLDLGRLESDIVAIEDLANGDAAGTCAAERKICTFLQSALDHKLPRALQGAARPLDDVDPSYPHVLTAVQSSFNELVYDAHYDTLAVLWSPRCTCAPGLLESLDAMSAEMRNAHPTIRIVFCDVDANELSEKDWPSDPLQQVLPCLRFYPASDKAHPAAFHGHRTVESIAQFIGCSSSLPTSQTVDSCAISRATELRQMERPRKRLRTAGSFACGHHEHSHQQHNGLPLIAA